MDDKSTDDDGQWTAGQCSDGRWSMLDAQMVDARHSDGRQVPGRRRTVDEQSTVGWSTVDSQMVDSRRSMVGQQLTTMDVCCIQHEANTTRVHAGQCTSTPDDAQLWQTTHDHGGWRMTTADDA